MSVEKVRAALAASQDTYVKVRAGDLKAACEEIGPAAKGLGAIANSACEWLGNNGPDSVMQIHREAHGKLFTAPAPSGS